MFLYKSHVYIAAYPLIGENEGSTFTSVALLRLTHKTRDGIWFRIRRNNALICFLSARHNSITDKT